MDIPPEIEIPAGIRPGTVYYFSHERLTSTNPHYFVVINCDPLRDAIVLLLCASSKVNKRRLWYSACPGETLVVVHPHQYPEFSVPTIINCNEVFEVTVDQLIKKRASGLLELKSEISKTIVEELRKGVIASPLVERRIKSFLNQPT